LSKIFEVRQVAASSLYYLLTLFLYIYTLYERSEESKKRGEGRVIYYRDDAAMCHT